MPKLPRQAGVLDARQRRSARAAVVARDQHVVGVRLHDAGGDRADADLGDELHADARRRVRVLQVVDQLRQILDRVDVVVRRRADQARRPESSSESARCCRRPSCRAARRPSPGFAPCAILICSSSAFARYQIVTPKRPDAICLIAERSRVAVRQRRESRRVFAALRRCCSCRRCGSSRWRAFRAPRRTASRSSSRRCRTA